MELDILDIVLMVSKQFCSGVTRRVVAVSDLVGGRGEKEAFFFICAILFKRRYVRDFNRLVDLDCCSFS